MKIIERAKKHKILTFGSLLCLFLAIIFLSLSFFLTTEASEKNQEKSLRQLKNLKQTILKEFQNSLDEMHFRQSLIHTSPFPVDKKKVFSLLKTLVIDPEIEGAGYYNNKGEVLLWFGNVVDVKDIFAAQTDLMSLSENRVSLLVKNKALNKKQ